MSSEPIPSSTNARLGREPHGCEPQGELQFLEVDTHRILVFHSDEQNMSAWEGKTHFNTKAAKWIIQTSEPEPANIDVLFSFALRAGNDFDEACRLYAIGHHMHRNQAPSTVPADAFDMNRVNMERLEQHFKTMTDTQQADMRARQRASALSYSPLREKETQ